jgi:ABC-type nitrate/sulfonate/bicarbonate transport system ATPase subunit
MLQRVGLAQALMHSPSLLILDEPGDGVDPVGRRQIREILQSLEEKGVTIFLNSHLLSEVELFCNPHRNSGPRPRYVSRSLRAEDLLGILRLLDRGDPLLHLPDED